MRHRHKHIKNRLRHLKPKRSMFTRPVFWVIALGLLVLGSLFYLFFFFGPLQAQVVAVAGNEKITGQDIETAAWQSINKKVLGINNKNIFTVNAAALENNLLAGFPGLENVTVKKHWFKNINVEVSERKAVAVLCPTQSAQDCYLIDIHGVAFEPAYSIAGHLVIREGQVAINESIMQAIVKVRDDLKNNFQINVKEVLSSNPLIFTTTEGWQIYFDPKLDISTQITKLDLLLKNEINPTVRKNLKYVYLQYKDRAYYK